MELIMVFLSWVESKSKNFQAWYIRSKIFKNIQKKKNTGYEFRFDLSNADSLLIPEGMLNHSKWSISLSNCTIVYLLIYIS